MSFIKYVTVIFMVFFIANCSTPEEKGKREKVIPNKITILFVTQPECPSCTKLEEIMALEKPKRLIENYFEVKKIYLGEKIPAGLPEPNGTPTVYFLGSNDEALVEPIIGEKNETELLEYLNDALYEFKVVYKVDIKEIKKAENNETDLSTSNS
jgi:hypothetical protein